MRLSDLILLASLLIFARCGAKQPSTFLPNGGTLPTLNGDNVMKLTVNGSLCSSPTYPNKPCVSIQICTPGTSQCQVINDILVDTGSTGLRVFKSLLSVTPTPIVNGANTLAECSLFGDGSMDWGPIETADVILGNEPAVRIPIQVIDSTFSNPSQICPSSDVDPRHAGFNGILGVGVFQQDCGPDCVSKPGNNLYFACTSSSCNSTTVSLPNQVTNPVSQLPQDNNGVIVELPSIPLGGVSSIEGYLVLGIGTRSNNAPANVTAYSADPRGEFSTSFNGQTLSAFTDSGSNSLLFPNGTNIPDCGSVNAKFSGLYCPSSVQNLTATAAGSSGSPTKSIPFQIGNFIDLINSSNAVFLEIGANGSRMFDWGLPFYIGRNIYVGLEKTSSTLGSGPYWAF